MAVHGSSNTSKSKSNCMRFKAICDRYLAHTPKQHSRIGAGGQTIGGADKPQHLRRKSESPTPVNPK